MLSLHNYAILCNFSGISFAFSALYCHSYCHIVASACDLYKIERLTDVTSINVNCTLWREFDVNGKSTMYYKRGSGWGIMISE